MNKKKIKEIKDRLGIALHNRDLDNLNQEKPAKWSTIMMVKSHVAGKTGIVQLELVGDGIDISHLKI